MCDEMSMGLNLAMSLGMLLVRGEIDLKAEMPDVLLYECPRCKKCYEIDHKLITDKSDELQAKWLNGDIKLFREIDWDEVNALCCLEGVNVSLLAENLNGLMKK